MPRYLNRQYPIALEQDSPDHNFVWVETNRDEDGITRQRSYGPKGWLYDIQRHARAEPISIDSGAPEFVITMGDPNDFCRKCLAPKGDEIVFCTHLNDVALEVEHFSIDGCDYTIITEEPNLLVVDVWLWDEDWNPFLEGINIEKVRRVTIAKPYIIETREPRRLVIQEADK